MWTHCCSCICSSLSSSVSATSLALVAVEIRGHGEGQGGRGGPPLQQASAGGQERAAEHEQRHGCAVSRTSALRLHPLCPQRASGLIAVGVRGCGEKDGLGRCGGRGGRGQEQVAEHERQRRRAIACALFSASVLCMRNEPPCLLLFSPEGADGQRGGRGTRRGGQAGHERLCGCTVVVPLLFASLLRMRDEPPGSLLFSPENAGTDGEEDGAGRCGGRRG